MADPSQPEQRTQRLGHREMMFCHECQDEWYRDEGGLTCPECGSDFTEIIEDDNDPRDHHLLDRGDSDDETNSLHARDNHSPHQHPLHHHPPWRDSDDPEEGDISNLQWRQVGPGRFAVTGTMYRTVSPADLSRGGNGVDAGPIGGFAAMLNSIIGGSRTQQHNLDPEPGETQASAQFTPNSGTGTTPDGHRFTYTAGARLHPRDPNTPGPRMEPVDELNNVLVGLMAAFGDPARGHHHHHHFNRNAHDDGHNEDGNMRGPPLNPLMALFSQMMTGNGQIGDAVYSQEALDRIISQLMEQNATSNAPGPASQNDIDSLPRKPVTREMLGSEGKAECSICMDEVHLGEEVTELPCHHWFHHPCVSAWLTEHDTCPHCRKGISKTSEANREGSALPARPDASPSAAPPTSSPSRHLPGSFDISGNGSPEHPFTEPEASSHDRIHGDDLHRSREADASEGSSNAGLGERLRRGLFGPQS